jgi:hypothetical protein
MTINKLANGAIERPDKDVMGASLSATNSQYVFLTFIK